MDVAVAGLVPLLNVFLYSDGFVVCLCSTGLLIHVGNRFSGQSTPKTRHVLSLELLGFEVMDSREDLYLDRLSDGHVLIDRT